MTVTGRGWVESLAAVRAARPCASPNLGFLRQLEEFENTELTEVSEQRQNPPTPKSSRSAPQNICYQMKRRLIGYFLSEGRKHESRTTCSMSEILSDVDRLEENYFRSNNIPVEMMGRKIGIKVVI